MESTRFRVQSVIDNADENENYVEFGRLVVNPDYRGKEILARIIESLTFYSYYQGSNHIFVLAPPRNSVLYRRVCRSLGMDVQLHKNVDWGEKDAYRHLNLQLISCDINDLYSGKKTNEVLAG
jgi:hypothetical protein